MKHIRCVTSRAPPAAAAAAAIADAVAASATAIAGAGAGATAIDAAGAGATTVVLQFLPYIALFPIFIFTFHQSLGDLCTPISLHIFQLLLIAYSGAAMHSTLTHAQSAYSCTVCLLMHSTLTYAQPSCTVYKDIMDTHFQ